MEFETEEELEIAVERKFDRLDKRLMSGKLSQEEYDAEAKKIREWAEKFYDCGL